MLGRVHSMAGMTFANHHISGNTVKCCLKPCPQNFKLQQNETRFQLMSLGSSGSPCLSFLSKLNSLVPFGNDFNFSRPATLLSSSIVAIVKMLICSARQPHQSSSSHATINPNGRPWPAFATGSTYARLPRLSLHRTCPKCAVMQVA